MAYDRDTLFEVIKIELESDAHLSLIDLSRRIHVGRHTLSKAVKDAAGLSFRAFRSRQLLGKAKALLGNSPQGSIKEIAFEMGYGSQRALARFIKKQTSLQTRNFRQTIAHSGGLYDRARQAGDEE